jgi:hypothetical protein
MSKRFITRDQYLEDLGRGYTIQKWQPSGKKLRRDPFTGEVITVQPAAVDNYICMDCKYCSTNPEFMFKHRAGRNHPWGYGQGSTPYGKLYQVDIEGLDIQKVKEIKHEPRYYSDRDPAEGGRRGQ